jgi:hypothetical protein
MKKIAIIILTLLTFTLQHLQSARANTLGNVHIIKQRCSEQPFGILANIYFTTEKPFELFKIFGQMKGSFNSKGEWIQDPIIEKQIENFVRKHASNRDKAEVKLSDWKKSNDAFLRYQASKRSRISQCLVYLQIDGEITKNTLMAFRALRSNYANPPFLHVALNSVGGDVGAAIEIGRIIRQSYGITAVGMQNDYKGQKKSIGCFSACVLVYASGIAKQVGVSAKVGVHQHFLPKEAVEALSVEDGIRYLKETRKNISIYLDEMGVPQEFLSLANSINQTSLHMMSDKELRLYLPFAVPEYSAILPIKHNQAITGLLHMVTQGMHMAMQKLGRETQLIDYFIEVEKIIFDNFEKTKWASFSDWYIRNGIYYQGLKY